MTACLFHRGPDDGGDLRGAAGLGHRRLAVIDLSGGRQPLVHNTSKRALIYNGEIYNFRALRRELEVHKNQSFETDCDTEVLLHMASASEFQWLESLSLVFGGQSLLLARSTRR